MRALNDELRAIWFCALYFAGFDRMATRGGPTVPDIDFFGDAPTAAAALRAKTPRYANVYYAETTPPI